MEIANGQLSDWNKIRAKMITSGVTYVVTAGEGSYRIDFWFSSFEAEK